MASSGATDGRVLVMCGLLCLMLIGVHGTGSSTELPGSTQATTGDVSDGSTDEDPLESSLKHFYSIVTGFLGSLNTPPLTDPDSIININSFYGKNATDFTKVLSDKWQDFLKAYHGLAACMVVGVLFIIFMPIIGLIVCCCRTCCKRCTCKRNTRTDKSRCCKFSLSFVLFLLTSMILCACVFTFISGYLLREDFNPESDRNILAQTASSVSSLNTYVNDTVQELVTSVVRTFKHTSDSVLTSIKDTATDAVNDAIKTVNVSTFLDRAKALSEDVTASLKKLEEVKDTITVMKNLQSNLTDELTNIQTDVATIDCSKTGDQASCDGFKNDVNGSSVAVDYSVLNTLETEINNVNQTIDITSLVTDAEKEIPKVEAKVKDQIQTSINESETQVNKLQKTVTDEVDKIEKDIRDQLQKSLSSFEDSLTDAKTNVSKYNIVDYLYVLYGIAAVSGLICLFYYVALAYSVFGTQKDEAENCCTYECGAGFLVAGVAVTFILAWILMLVCFLMFAVGGSVYTLLCTDFVTHEPADLQGLENLIEEYVDFGDTIKNVSMTSMLSSCQENKALYQALQLQQLFDPNTAIDIQQLTAETENINQTAVNIDNITIISTSLETKINEFANSGIASINFTNYDTELNKNIVTGNSLSTLSTKAQTIADSLPDNPADVKAIKDKLDGIAGKLKTLQDANIASLETDTNKLKDAIAYLKNYTDIKAKVTALIQGMKSSEAEFNTNGKAEVQRKLSNLATSIINDVVKMKNDIINMVENELAKCKPLYNIFYGLTDIPCVTLLNHWNGYWFGLGWALAFSVPALIIALILAGLFRSDERIKAFLDDADVSGYESHGQDRIPLTSTQPSYNSDVQPYRVHDYGRAPSSSNYDNRAYRDDRDMFREPPPEYRRNGYPEERTQFPNKPYKY